MICDSFFFLSFRMDVKYLKKASGVLTASATLPPSAFDLPSYPAEVGVPVEVTAAVSHGISLLLFHSVCGIFLRQVHNSEGILVSKAEVCM